MQATIVLLVLASVSSAFGLYNPLHPTTWNGLKASWGVNPFNPWTMDSLPRTQDKAVQDGFSLVDSQCKMPGQNFRGMRYQYRDDPNVLLLFDRNGYIAGIQFRIAEDKLTLTAQNQGRAYIKDDTFWTLTTYFVDPETICTTGRTPEEFEAQGTGTELLIQNGTKPTDVFRVPRDEQDMKNLGSWNGGKCFPTMGQHYWFNIRDDMKDSEFFPYCVLYNGGRLDAFCFAANVFYDGSSRAEHPSSTDADRCCIHAPKFFFEKEDQRQTTMHVFLTDSPRTGLC